MPASKSFSRMRRSVAALCLLALGAMPLAASAQDGHAGHASMKASKKAELGTGAAVDARGRLWIAGKETAANGQYVTLQMSADGGKSWSAPRRIQSQPEAVSADGENRPKLAFGPHGALYISYTKPLAKPYTGEIRLVRSLDGGQTFLPPATVHANRDLITHRFDSLIVDPAGRIYVAWIDKRDVEAATAAKRKYAGAALYYAVSDDGGASFKGDFKAADHSCECCRIGLAINPAGRPVALWRHVFDQNVRDHALLELAPDGRNQPLARATFDQWKVDACPHQGPSLAYGADGMRHQVWFNMVGDEGGVFYAATDAAGKLKTPMKLGSAQAEHADVAVQGNKVVLAWKQFDGAATAILGKISLDGGATWQEREFARTKGDSDQPHLLATPAGIVLIWRTRDEGVLTLPAFTEK
jgi:hypothetical protein